MIVIHGDDLDQIDAKTRVITKEHRPLHIRHFYPKEISPSKLLQELGTSNLLGESSFVVIYNLFSQDKNLDKQKYFRIFSSSTVDKLLLVENSVLPINILNKFPKTTKVLFFKINSSIFQFVESVRPGNNTHALDNLFTLLQESIAPEEIFTMLVRQIRLLIQVSDPHLQSSLPLWLQKKLISQSKFWKQPALISFHKKLYQVDKSIKTGITPLTLKDELVAVISSL